MWHKSVMQAYPGRLLRNSLPHSILSSQCLSAPNVVFPPLLQFPTHNLFDVMLLLPNSFDSLLSMI